MRARQAVPAGESFLRGALMIALAGFISRLLGALYKPVATWLFRPYDGQNGEAGMGLTTGPAAAYLIVLAVSASGLNVAISKLVAERLARGRPDEARRVFRISLGLMAGLGLILAVAFYASAPFLAERAGRPETAAGFRAVAPAIFFVSVMAAYRGLFQGLQRMTPYAMSQIYEQIVRIVVGLFLIWLLAPRSVALGAAGYNFGTVAGAVVGLAYLLVLYLRGEAALPESEPARIGPGQREPAGRIVRAILAVAAPISLIAAVQPLMLAADAWIVIHRLEAVGIAGLQADAALGQLNNAFSVIWLPAMLTNALYISLVPAITESLEQGNREQARLRSVAAYRMTLLVGIPAATGLWVLGDGIYYLIFGGEGGPVLSAMSLGALFMMLQQTSSGILQGAGNIASPTRNLLAGLAVKVVLTYWLTATPLGARGAALATALGFAVAAGLNLLASRRQMGPLMDWTGMWLKPGAAAGVMALGAWWLLPLLEGLLGSVRLAVLADIALAAGIYAAVLLLIGGVQARDLLLIPRIGRPLADWLRRRGLVRE
ncbi:MAG: polysaccharide biosynthesis protein [Bacillota bacterium]